MMQNLGNRRSVQKCAQKAGSYVLKNVIIEKKHTKIFYVQNSFTVQKYIIKFTLA